MNSNNVFHFGKRTENHIEKFDQLPLAVDFCTSLGLRVQFLRKIDIDVSHVCPTLCPPPPSSPHHCGPVPYLDLAPLLKLIWDPILAEYAIWFVASKDSLITAPRFDFNVEEMNEFLECVRFDTAGLKKYAAQLDFAYINTKNEPHMDLVYVNFGDNPWQDDMRGKARLWYRSGAAGTKYIMLILLDEHRMNLRVIPEHSPTLLGVPCEIREAIYKYVLCPEGGVIFNPITRKRTAIESRLLRMGIPRGCTSDLNPDAVFWHNSGFIFRLSTIFQTMSSAEFQPLDGLFRREILSGKYRVPWDRFRFVKYPSFRLELEFTLEGGATLTNVRIGVRHLLWPASASHSIHVDMSLVHRLGISEVVDEHKTSLHSIQVQVHSFLARIIQVYPETASAGLSGFFVNGYGMAGGVEYTTKDGKRFVVDVLLTIDEIVPRVILQCAAPLISGSEVADHSTCDRSLGFWLRLL